MKYSVVIPVFNSEKTIGTVIDELVIFFSKAKLNFEIILVNDGSIDNSWNIIKKKRNKYRKNICAINFINNYGQQIANYCGLENSSGDYIITMDDDGQNPTEEIAKLIKKSKEKFELVIGKYIKKKHSFVRRFGSKLIRYVIGKIFKIPDNLHLSNFRIIKRCVVDRVCGLNINYPFLPGLLIEHSSSQANVLVNHKSRKHGSSRYNITKIIKLIFEIMFNYSTFPLRFFTFLGFIISMTSFGMGIFYILKAIIYGSEVQGWTTVVTLLSFLGGLILIILFMLGEYIIRVNKKLSSKEKYFIKEILN